MPSGTFEVGSNERHTLFLKISRLTGKVEIKLDGVEVPSGAISQSDFTTDFFPPTLTFTFGEREIHQLLIEPSKYLFSQYSVYLDGVHQDL